jgi:hypothetical protein
MFRRAPPPPAPPEHVVSLEVLVSTALAVVLVALVIFRKRPRGSRLPPASGVEEFTPTKRIGPFESVSDYFRRILCWLKVLLEYPKLCAVYRRHKHDGWFDYGEPPREFDKLAEHPATKALLNLRHGVATSRRRKVGFKSTLEFEADYPVLPTYLPIEEGAAAALGAVALAAAELFEARTGRAQRVIVSQSGAGLTTAQYLFIYAQPSGRWGGLHGFNGTMAAEGSVKPQRKAYECADGRWIFLHGGGWTQRPSYWT